MENYMEKLRQAIENNWKDQLATLRDLIAIPSVVGEPVTVRLGNAADSNNATSPGNAAGADLEQGIEKEENPVSGGSDKVAPANSGSGKVAPANSGSDKVAPANSGSDKVASANGGSDKATQIATYPFGPEVQRAFECVLAKGEAFGFETENVDNYGGHVELPGGEYDSAGELIATAEEVMGIVGHLDVVPAGSRDRWTHDPFEMIEEEGILYGRGVMDDKGPTVAGLFAMKAIVDAGFMPKTTVRLILGLDEEVAWQGLPYYNERVKEPDFAIIPDGEFPVVNAEKGILIYDLAKKFGKHSSDGLELRSMSGGAAPNMVADTARVVVLNKKPAEYEPIKDKADRWREEGRGEFKARTMGKNLEITVTGKSAHGSTPELGVNAISKMMAFLSDINFNCDEVNEFIEFYNTCIGEETDGESLGCAFADEPSGCLINNVGMVKADGKAITLTCNIRYPVTVTGPAVYDAMAPACAKYDVGIVKGTDKGPIYQDPDSPFISTLLNVYREHTGDKESGPLVMGGGTYARLFKKAVAFGSQFPGRPDCFHQPDEMLYVEDFKKMTLIYADAIYRFCVAK